MSEPEAADAADDDADIEEDYSAPKFKLKAKPQEKSALPDNITPKRRGRPPGKKTKVNKTVPATVAKPRKARARKGGANFDAEQVAKDTKITNDNPLFSASPFYTRP